MNAQADSIKDQVDIIQRQMTLANDRQGRVNIGGTVVYLHTLKNTGTVVEGMQQARSRLVLFRKTQMIPLLILCIMMPIIMA